MGAKNIDVFNGSIDSLAQVVSEIVSEATGVILGETQQSMVITRIKKRMIDLGNISAADYHSVLINNFSSEKKELISLLTTHHTFFFREFNHFEYLSSHLSSFVENVKRRGDNKLKIHCAACSTGQEVYSLASFLEHHLQKYPEMSYEIIGTDVDHHSIETANKGIYKYNEVKSIPHTYLTGNWQRGIGKVAKYARVKDNIKRKCHFKVANLLDIGSFFKGYKFDIIFCRNAFIYFDTETVKKISKDFKKQLHKNGILFTGVSESLNSMDANVHTLAPSIYSFEKRGSKVIPFNKKPAQNQSQPLKVLVVDDSPSIVKILTKVFKDDQDFEFVGSAKNGLEAQDFLKNNAVDVMTLDIHMPEMNGVEYLKKNYCKRHPKVVIVSSASREDLTYSQAAIDYGASDFVEKPALNNIQERADEIKIKLKMSVINDQITNHSELHKSFSKGFKIDNCNNKARVLFSTYSDLKKVKTIVSQLKGDQPPIFLFFEGSKPFFPIIEKEISKAQVYSPETKIEINSIYICDFGEHYNVVNSLISKFKVSYGVLGLGTDKLRSELSKLNGKVIFIEEVDGQNSKFLKLASHTFPWTSFAHLGTEFLAEDDHAS